VNLTCRFTRSYEELYLLGCNSAYFIESQLKFRRNMMPPSSGLKTKQKLVSCLAYASTLKMEATCSSKMLANFNGLRDVIPQKVELFITTVERTSNPTHPFFIFIFKHFIFISMKSNVTKIQTELS
jgi:hypothetical protein